MGCFEDKNNNRVLGVGPKYLSNNGEHECEQYCLERNIFKYFGLQVRIYQIFLTFKIFKTFHCFKYKVSFLQKSFVKKIFNSFRKKDTNSLFSYVNFLKKKMTKVLAVLYVVFFLCVKHWNMMFFISYSFIPLMTRVVLAGGISTFFNLILSKV